VLEIIRIRRQTGRVFQVQGNRNIADGGDEGGLHSRVSVRIEHAWMIRLSVTRAVEIATQVEAGQGLESRCNQYLVVQEGFPEFPGLKAGKRRQRQMGVLGYDGGVARILGRDCGCLSRQPHAACATDRRQRNTIEALP